jgi:hypothetical protein
LLVVAGLFIIARLVVFRSRAMMLGGMFGMFGGFVMMIDVGLRHDYENSRARCLADKSGMNRA